MVTATYFDLISPLLVSLFIDTVKNCASSNRMVAEASSDPGPDSSASVTVKLSTEMPGGWFSSRVTV